MYTDKSSVEGWEVAIAGDNNFQIVLKTDKNGLYSQVTQVELGKVTNFTISVKDPCQNAAQVQKQAIVAEVKQVALLILSFVNPL